MTPHDRAVAPSEGVDLRRVRKNGQRRGTNLSGSERRRVVVALVRRDGDECHWCGGPFTKWLNDPMARSIDHIVPRKKGGTEAISNLVLAHRICNEKRANPPLGRRRVASDD